MSKRITVGLLAVGVFFFQSICFAETIYLKTGKKIRGQIIERNDKQIRVEISGVKITYYMDEIDHIEDTGNPPAPAAKSNPPVEPSASMKEQIVETPSVTVPSFVKTSFETPSSEKIFPPTASSPATTPAAITPRTDSKKTLIMDLIDASGTKETMSQMFTQIIAQSPTEQAASLKSVLNVNEIIPRLIPVYDKYFTEEELKELIAFYKGTTGRKLIKVMPSIMEDSMKATEAYFQEKMPAPSHDSSGPASENQKK